MTLKDFYKKKIYEYGYEVCERDAKNGTDNRDGEGDIYLEDECDFYICSDYYSSFVGSPEDWSEDDLEFLNALGLNAHDFEVETDYE